MGPLESNDELRNLIYGVIPGLRRRIGNEQYGEAVFDIRNWVGHVMNFSSRELLAEHRHASAYVMYNDFTFNHKGAWCGAAACFFARVLELFGIGAFSYNYGLHDRGLSHQTTVVLYYEDDEVSSPIVDAYLGYTYTDAHGKELSWHDLLRRVAGREYGDIRLASYGYMRDVMLLPGQDPAPFSWLFPHGMPEPEAVDGIVAYRGGRIDYPTLFGGQLASLAREICGDTPVEHFYLDLMLHNIVLDPISLPGSMYKQWRALSQAMVDLAEVTWKERKWQV